MSTTTPGAPPAAPPAPPAGGQLGVAFHEDGEPRGTVQVTRNVPPKRVMVTPGNSISYAGVSYNEGDQFLIGDGPVADAFAIQGLVVITSHEEVDAWNGKEGRAIAERAFRHIDNSHVDEAARQAFANYMAGDTTADDLHTSIEEARASIPERTHDHGFGKYEHADGEQGYPAEVTTYRQQLAAEHMARGSTMDDDPRAGGRKGGRS